MTSRLVARRRRAVPLAVVALAALAAALLTVPRHPSLPMRHRRTTNMAPASSCH
jgi:hypothetical protein